MAVDDEIRFDRSLLGVEHAVGSFLVTEEMIVGFARSTGETDPVFTDETRPDLIAPPTFCNIFASGIARPDIKLEFGDTGFFAGQAIECLAPVRPGDILKARIRLKDVYAKTGRSGKMVFIVWQTSFTNQDGRTVALVEESSVRRNRGG